MSNEFTPGMATADSIRYRKNCKDFECLDDGTIYRECKYCNLSTLCRQVDIVNGNPVAMETHYCPVVNPITNEVIEWQYYCTGLHDKRSLNERTDGDDKIS